MLSMIVAKLRKVTLLGLRGCTSECRGGKDLLNDEKSIELVESGGDGSRKLNCNSLRYFVYSLIRYAPWRKARENGEEPFARSGEIPKSFFELFVPVDFTKR